MNKVILTGFVGKDPEIKNFNDGDIANVTLATTERGYKLQNGTEVPEHTDWHNLVFRGGLAGIVQKFVKKGSKLLVFGKIRYRQYESNGQQRYVTEVIVEDMEMLNKQQDPSASPNSPVTDDDDAPF